LLVVVVVVVVVVVDYNLILMRHVVRAPERVVARRVP
jgi:hypothetical protein